MKKTVFLVGGRCAGKSVVGARLAGLLGLELFDIDVYIGSITGMTVADIVARDGWVGYRRLEAETLKKAKAEGMVVAPGGGIVLSPASRIFMRDTGVVVYLAAPAHVLAKRMAALDELSQRPSLTGKHPLDEIAEVMEQREPLYRSAAHYVVDASKSIDEVADSIIKILAKIS